MNSEAISVHGTAVAFGEQGILIRGAPGSGKSSLALQLIDAPGFGIGGDLLRAQLVADDQVQISQSSGVLAVSAPENLSGLLEIRGVGLITVSCVASARLVMIADLVPQTQIERLPEPLDLACELAGVMLPRIRIDAAFANAAARLRAAFCHFTNH
jgi:serine kinase of HPr protein (carbohydrate metabolism regulator)